MIKAGRQIMRMEEKRRSPCKERKTYVWQEIKICIQKDKLLTASLIRISKRANKPEN